MSSAIQNQAKLVGMAAAAAVALTMSADVAFAQSGKFTRMGANAPVCTDEGTTVLCTGKVTGLGGTTFEITIEADGTASVQCRNSGGNVAPGQNTAVTVEGSTDPLPTPTNGNYNFTVETDDPEPLPSTPTCPNRRWTAEIVDITFTTAILSLFENDVLTDQVTVMVR